jgi:VWFA-related protein
LPNLNVKSRSLVFRYKGKSIDSQKVGEQLGVRSVLTGRILRLDDRVIVRTEVIDVKGGWQIWGDQYHRPASDILAVQESVALWEPYGKTGLHDAVALLPQISNDSRNVKRAAILVTDGVDNASRITADQAREIVQKSELPVYVFGLSAGDPYAAPADPKNTYLNADMLNLLAHQTGGRFYSIEGPDDLKEACAEIAEDLRYQYVLGFETAATGTPAYRSIAVTVKGRKVKQVTHRKGYKGLPPAAG